MGWVEAMKMLEVRFARRCWVSVAGVEKGEVVVRAGDMYVVETALDDWYVVPGAVRRPLAKLFNVSEQDILLEC